jgi:hypothetical protein
MKAISLWQPWASLWLTVKRHETRARPLSHRGWLLVHATKHIAHDLDPALADIVDSEFGSHWGMDLPRGALIGIVKIVGCKPVEQVYPGGAVPGMVGCQLDDFTCGNFAAGRFAIERREVKVFRAPIPFRGQQTLFDVPFELVREALTA